MGELWLSVDVPLSAVLSELDERLPRVLAAEEDRPIGAPGQVSYRVTRRKARVVAQDGRVAATLPVDIDLSLCKPFGSLCVGYGSCSPSYDIKATLDLTLSTAHELPAVRLSQKVREGCRIGVDVTDQVTRVVSDQLREIERRIERERPPLSFWIDRAVAELTRPTMLTVGECVAFAPSEILLDGPTTRADRLTFGIGAAGTVAESACDAPLRRGRGLPVRRVVESGSAPQLELREHLDTESVSAAVRQAIDRASKPTLGLSLVEQEVVEGGILLGVELRGARCGLVWVLSDLDVKENHLVLRNARILTGDLSTQEQVELTSALTTPLDLQSTVPRFLDDLGIEERTQILRTLVGERTTLKLSVTAPQVERVRVVSAPDGVWILSMLDSRLHLAASEEAAR